MRAESALYRSLLRIAREADKQPQQLVTLIGWPSQVFDKRHNKVVTQVVTKFPLVEDAVWEACGGSIEFAHPSACAADAFRRHRRRIKAMGFDYISDARELLKRLEHARRSFERVLTATVPKARVPLPPLELEFISGTRAGSKLVLSKQVAEKAHSGKWMLGEPALPDSATAAVSDLASREALKIYPLFLPSIEDFQLRRLAEPNLKLSLHRIGASSPSPVSFGDILIAHPLTGLSQPSLNQAVVVVSALCKTRASARGIVVNKLARGTLRSVLAAWSCRTGDGGLVKMSEADQRAMEALEPLLDANVLSGGDLKSSSLFESITWLHSLGDAVPGSLEVMPSLRGGPSVCIGGDIGIMAGLVASGQADLSRVRPVLGYAAWSTQQLELELKRGVWVRARTAAPEVALRLCMAALPSADDSRAQEQHQSFAWRAALHAAGLPALACFPRSTVVDESLRSLISEHYAGPHS